MEEKRFREVMGYFATGVTVVTTRAKDGAPRGLTVSAFTSVSLDPILVMVCIHKEANALPLLVPGAPFAVNILSSSQSEVATRFATGVAEERFLGMEAEETPRGNPRIPGSIAWLDCRVAQAYPGGDHSVLLADVESCHATGGEPLLFFRGALRGWIS